MPLKQFNCNFVTHDQPVISQVKYEQTYRARIAFTLVQALNQGKHLPKCFSNQIPKLQATSKFD